MHLISVKNTYCGQFHWFIVIKTKIKTKKERKKEKEKEKGKKKTDTS